MIRAKIVTVIIVAFSIGCAAGFGLRPVLVPPESAMVGPPAVAPSGADARGVQYFEANVEEARRIVERCRNGTVRGAECSNAEAAIIRVEAEERRERFLGQ